MKISLNSFIRKSSTACLVWLCATSIAAHAGQRQQEAKAVEPPPADPWKFDLAIPGWLANLSGTVGVDGHNVGVYLDTGDILRHTDMLASFSAEVRKGRFGIYGDLLYVDLSDGIAPGGLIEKVNVGLTQWLVDLELNYRVLEGPRGFLDVRVGVRYNNIGSSLETSPDDDAIDAASKRFVDTAAADLRNLLKNDLLKVLNGEDPVLPIPPLSFEQKLKLIKAIDAVRRDPELAAAIKAQAEAKTAALRADAQKRIDAAKKRVSNKIARVLKDGLDQSLSLTEDWWDPYVGIRARFNLNKAWYLTGKADIGGFGVGSQITWQGYAALGCQITRYIYAEAGYRYLYTDYDNNNFVYKVTQSGAEITLGVIF